MMKKEENKGKKYVKSKARQSEEENHIWKEFPSVRKCCKDFDDDISLDIYICYDYIVNKQTRKTFSYSI